MKHARLVRNNEYAENNDYGGNSALKLDAGNASANVRSFFSIEAFFFHLSGDFVIVLLESGAANGTGGRAGTGRNECLQRGSPSRLHRPSPRAATQEFAQCNPSRTSPIRWQSWTPHRSTTSRTPNC